jgi:hypothetical protein
LILIFNFNHANNNKQTCSLTFREHKKEQREKLRSKAGLSTSAEQGQQMPQQARHDGVCQRLTAF